MEKKIFIYKVKNIKKKKRILCVSWFLLCETLKRKKNGINQNINESIERKKYKIIKIHIRKHNQPQLVFVFE
jgi:hypothetical protein